MADTRFSTLFSGFTFLEGPRWHNGRLWASDFYTHQVVSSDMSGNVEVVAEVPNQPSGLGWLPDGRLLVVSMRDRKVLRQERDGSLVVHADLSGIATWHANDMVVDSRGNAYVGNFGFDLMSGAPFATAPLAWVLPSGEVKIAAENLYFPNGSAITPDGRTLILGETFGHRISAFSINPDGSLGPRRDWAVFGPLLEPTDLQTAIANTKVAPDGMSVVDAQGAVWVADAIHNRVLRVAEGGRILEEISTGEMAVFACALGGPDGRTLFACVAPDFDERRRTAAREAAMWMTQVSVPAASA